MYIVRQKETGTIINCATSETFANFLCELYEGANIVDGIYEPDSYEVWYEERIIYDVNQKKYYELEMFIPPFFDDNPKAIFIFRDIQDSENRLRLVENRIEDHFYGGIEFMEWWRENHVK